MRWLEYISSGYQKLIQIGVNEELSFAEKLRTELCNQFIVIALPALLIQFVYNLLGPNILHQYFLILLWGMIFSVTLLLNYHQKYLSARIYTLLIPLIMVTAVFVLFGLKTRIDFVYPLVMLISCYILDRNNAIRMIALITATYVLAIIYLDYVPPPLEQLIVPTGVYAYFTFTVIVIIVQTNKILNEHRNYSDMHLQQNQKLATQKKDLKRFTYIASHDLKSPLNNIIGFADLLEEELKTSNKKKVLDYLQYVQISAQEMHSLIEDILQLSKVRDDENREQSNFDLNDAFSKAIEYLGREISLRKASINCNDLPYYYGNKMELRLLFQNLIQNGIKYNQSPIPKVEIWSVQSKESLFLYFKDNGIGIPQKHQTAIFESFKRLHTKKEYPGTGIGLSLCKKIAQNHNGQISVKSIPQEGSIFVVELPLNQ